MNRSFDVESESRVVALLATARRVMDLTRFASDSLWIAVWKHLKSIDPSSLPSNLISACIHNWPSNLNHPIAYRSPQNGSSRPPPEVVESVGEYWCPIVAIQDRSSSRTHHLSCWSYRNFQLYSYYESRINPESHITLGSNRLSADLQSLLQFTIQASLLSSPLSLYLYEYYSLQMY